MTQNTKDLRPWPQNETKEGPFLTVKEVSERVLASTVWEYLVCQPQYDEGAITRGAFILSLTKLPLNILHVRHQF